MSTQTVIRRSRSTTSNRSLHSVQRVLRALIWFGLFFLLGILTLGAAFLVSTVADFLGYAAFVVGGLLTLIIPGMVNRCLYVIPEFERVVVLKMGKFTGVEGPGKFWVIPYPPFYQSVAAKSDMRVWLRRSTDSGAHQVQSGGTDVGNRGGAAGRMASSRGVRH
jgi:regulator of protease activity HflC (stomatin/prohibitin superfamily)